MGVNVNRFIGYTLDVTDEFIKASKEDEKIYDKWIDNCHNNDSEYKDYLKRIRFKSYYDSDLENNITLLYDGLNGEYAKLIYVIAASKWSDCDDMEENIINAINKLLAESKIGIPLIDHFKTVYKELFNKELTNTKNIKAEYIIHYS